MSASPVVVWGAGAIGGTLGAYWLQAGRDVLFVDSNPRHVMAIQKGGLKITGPLANFVVNASAVSPEEVEGEYDWVMLCVKAQHTADATKALLPHLASDGCVVSVQNGLNEKVISSQVGRQRTMGAFVNFGADYMEPGIIHYGGRGAVVVGELNGKTSPRLRYLHALFLIFDERAVLTDNIWGYLWGKLAYGALLFATALTNDSIADCLDSPRFRPLFVRLVREVLGVAAGVGVSPEGFDGFDPTAFSSRSAEGDAVHSLDDLVAHNRRSAKSHSGIWRDLAVHRRGTEVDAQLGAVVESASGIGMEVPITERLIELIHEVEEGKRAQGLSTLAELENATN